MKILKAWLCYVFILFLLLSNSSVFASDYQKVFTFEKENLRIEKVSGFDLVKYKDLNLSQEIGAPQLPVKLVQFSLPPGKEIAGIEIVNSESEYLDQEFSLFPVQPPQVLSKKTIEFHEPDTDVYSSSKLYPENIVRFSSQGYFSGYSMGAIVIYPLQYVPAQKKLLFHTRIEVQITYKDSERKQVPFKMSSYSESIQLNALKNIAKPTHLNIFDQTQSISELPNEEHTYVIITSDALATSFQPLADWKLKKGLSATIVTTSWIEANYSGIDAQERIREFIKEAYQQWGTIWVVLGGDNNIIPDRKAFAMDCEYGNYSDNYIPCDLYYSDLDGDWNANGNDLYGEVDDNIDMYPEVYVGRVSVENATEAEAFVNKILTYEKNPPSDYVLNMLYLAEVLWSDPYTNSGLGKNLIDSLYVPSRFDPITKLYQDLGNENYSTAMDALNAGKHIINHDGHAWYSIMSVGDGSLGLNDMDILTNGPNYSILFTIGCWPAAFDYDCMAEHFITNPNGGGVAFIGNSRYGWGSPGNPEYGYSDRFDQQFFKAVFLDDIYHIGSALATAKATYVPFADNENVYRWCEYEINLFGDPEMPIWTDTPQQLTVEYPDSLPAGESICSITVKDGSSPIEGALVCLLQWTNVYASELTGSDGRTSLRIAGASPSEPLQLTVTAQNFYPFESTIDVITNDPYVQISSYSTNGSLNGYVKPGELVTMNVCFKNFGSETANAIACTLQCNDEKISMVDSSESIASLLSGDSSIVTNAFSFVTSSDLSDKEVIFINSTITDNQGNTWSDVFSVTGITPILTYFRHQSSDTANGNNNGIIEPGERISVIITIQNSGLDSAMNVIGSLSSIGTNLTILNSTINFNDIASAGYASAITEIEVNSLCPDTSFQQVNLSLDTDGGFQFLDSLLISVGEIGFIDKMETVSDNWSHSGQLDLWHITTGRKHSGNHSWYCGYYDIFHYENDMSENILESKQFVIGENSTLSFWAWCEFPNYGTTGLYVDVSDGTGWKNLDFVGSGGALGYLPTGNDWFKFQYALSDYPVGTKLKLRFRFQSDDEIVTEGVYIDDVVVQDYLQNTIITVAPFPPKPEVDIEETGTSLILDWDNDIASTIENFDQEDYTFQGYNIYQLKSSVPLRQNGVHVATFDVVDNITVVNETIINPVTGTANDTALFLGTNSGISRSIQIDKDYLDDIYFIRGKKYYFGISAYAYHSETALPKCSESAICVLEIIYQEDETGPAYGDTIAVVHTNGEADGVIAPIIRDPNLLTGHTYSVDFSNFNNNLAWNLNDVTDSEVLLENQTSLGEDDIFPIIDGFQLVALQPELLDYSQLNIIGAGYYYIYSFFTYDWAPSARAVDNFHLYYGGGGGTSDIQELCKDYQLRFSGEYIDPSANIIYVSEGTGSIATLFGASYYDIADHPMNPNPGSSDPFTIRIPFEIWNVADNQQVNLIIQDRVQSVDANPFYAFNPYGRMYCWILNTTYHENVVDIDSKKDSLTWNLVFSSTEFIQGDVINIDYDNPFSTSDTYQFSTPIITDTGGVDDFITYELFQNYPNPFNKGTKIKFQLENPEPVKIEIYDIRGALIKKFNVPRGVYEITWDGMNENKKGVSTGIYFYRIVSLKFVDVRKMILLK